MAHVEVSAGTIEYDDTCGNGPVVVFVDGLLMDGAQWRHVVANLRNDFRCVLPTLPMGAHRRPMRPDADLSLRGLGRILTEFLDRLDLMDVTLCFNDWCCAYRKSNPGILVVQSAQDRATENASNCLGGA